MKLSKMLSFGLAAAMTLSLSMSAYAGEAKSANVDPANTEMTDETIVINLSAEPSALWGYSGQTGSQYRRNPSESCDRVGMDR